MRLLNASEVRRLFDHTVFPTKSGKDGGGEGRGHEAPDRREVETHSDCAMREGRYHVTARPAHLSGGETRVIFPNHEPE